MEGATGLARGADARAATGMAGDEAEGLPVTATAGAAGDEAELAAGEETEACGRRAGVTGLGGGAGTAGDLAGGCIAGSLRVTVLADRLPTCAGSVGID